MVDGELVVLYDVKREEKAGELEVRAQWLWFYCQAHGKELLLFEQTPRPVGGFQLPGQVFLAAEKGLKSYYLIIPLSIIFCVLKTK